MIVNITKTKWMIFENRPCVDTVGINMWFTDNEIERVKTVKYLGVLFSEKMNFAEHVTYVLSKAEKAAYLFWKYTNRFLTMRTSVLLNLFNVLVTLIILNLSFIPLLSCQTIYLVYSLFCFLL